MHKKSEEDPAQLKEMQDKQFRITILQQRATRFENNALQKYEQMDLKLQEEPLLEVLKK